VVLHLGSELTKLLGWPDVSNRAVALTSLNWWSKS